MAEFKYTPDRDIKVHEEGTIKLLCASFQSHENGLPEWPKNAADQYARGEVPSERRLVLLIFSDGKKGAPPSICCLDFAGMTTEVIEDHFRNWGSPEAALQATRAKGIQGGHGNGGKCYMTQMFEDYAMLHSVSNGRGCRYGVQGGSIRFGYIPDPSSGRNFEVSEVSAELEEVLKLTGCTISGLPEEARTLLGTATGFTLVKGVKPKGYKNKIPAMQLVDGLREHPQMLHTLQLCRVFIIVNGKVANNGEPLVLPEIEPMEGAEKPRCIPIPQGLKDPVSKEKQSTTDEGQLPEGQLVLRTSKTSMRWGKKARHSIIFEAQSGYIGYVPVPELDIQSPFRDHIYGVCRLEALESFKQNDRARLAEGALTRAVERFIAYEIQRYSEEFETKEKRRYDKKERNEISRINEALDKWKNRFLEELMQGRLGKGVGPPPSPPPLPTGTPRRIELAVPSLKLGKGVGVRPNLRFFDDKENRIRAVPFWWVSEDTNVAMVDEDLGIINSFSYGTTTIYAETLDGKVRSNRVFLEVLPIRRIRIAPSEVQVRVGGRQRLEAICTLADGHELRDVRLIWTENDSSIARVSSGGMVFGFALGQTEVSAADDNVTAENSAVIEVVVGEGRDQGDKPGRGFAKVLVSGIDPDPDTGEPVTFSREYPPVWQRPLDADRNIWWINSTAPLAKIYLDTSREYGYHTREWRMYHLERYIDVIAEIALRYESLDAGAKSVNEWILARGAKLAEIHIAAAEDLEAFISNGDLPGE